MSELVGGPSESITVDYSAIARDEIVSFLAGLIRENERTFNKVVSHIFVHDRDYFLELLGLDAPFIFGAAIVQDERLAAGQLQIGTI